MKVKGILVTQPLPTPGTEIYCFNFLMHLLKFALYTHLGIKPNS